MTVLDDYSEKEQKTVWFNSRFYRANLLWERDTLRIRDIHLFDETFASEYVGARGTSSRCLFHTLPLVDGFRWSSKDVVAGLRLRTRAGQSVRGGTPTVRRDKDRLVVRWPTTRPAGEVVFSFDESTMSVSATGPVAHDWEFALTHAENAKLPFETVEDQRLECGFEGRAYPIRATHGTFSRGDTGGLRITPNQGRVTLDLTRR